MIKESFLSYSIICTHRLVFIKSLDYGSLWEEAWERHIASWSPPPNDGSFVPVSDMNLNVEKYLLTKEEIENGSTYPHKHVRIGCNIKGAYFPCLILQKENRVHNSTEYLVSVRKWSHEGETELDHFNDFTWPFNNDNKTVRVKLPSDEIKFFAGSFSSDQHMEGAFRHHIGVPNYLWPKQWMNLKRPNPYPKVLAIALFVGVTAALAYVNEKLLRQYCIKVSPWASPILMILCIWVIFLRLGILMGNALAY